MVNFFNAAMLIDGHYKRPFPYCRLNNICVYTHTHNIYIHTYTHTHTHTHSQTSLSRVHILRSIAGPGIVPMQCYQKKHCFLDYHDNLEYQAYLKHIMVALGICLCFFLSIKTNYL